ncbi:MAG: hypothetical protein E6J91_42850 [Deltaproteobacteria bacterium]|nr:MAG: hypothetical protein E6J91_42850 [Deltaproteobacteria bacterium]
MSTPSSSASRCSTTRTRSRRRSARHSRRSTGAASCGRTPTAGASWGRASRSGLPSMEASPWAAQPAPRRSWHRVGSIRGSGWTPAARCRSSCCGSPLARYRERSICSMPRARGRPPSTGERCRAAAALRGPRRGWRSCVAAGARSRAACSAVAPISPRGPTPVRRGCHSPDRRAARSESPRRRSVLGACVALLEDAMRRWIALSIAALSLTFILSRVPGRAPPRPELGRAARVAVPGDQPTPSPGQRRWDPGLDRTYALDFTTRLAGATQPIDVRVQGDWQTTVVDDADRHATLRLQLGRAQVSSPDGPAPAAMLDEMGRPWFVELDRKGRIAAAWFDPVVGRPSRDLLKTLAAYLQYCSPGNDCHGTEQDATGMYEADYESARGDDVTRSKSHYVSIVTARGPAPPADVGGPDVQTSRGRFELDPDGWPVRTTMEETLRVSVAGTRQTFSNFEAARAGMRRYAPLAEVPDARSTAENLDRQELGGADYQQLMGELAAARDPHAEVAVQRRLRALFALEPDDARRAATMLRDATLPIAARKTVIAALAAAGTPEAQRALVDSLAGPSTTELRQQTLASLGMVATPSADTVAALQAISDAPAEPGDQHTVLLAIGSMARHLGHSDDDPVMWLIERLRGAASSQDVVICLRALGNTADPRALHAFRFALQSSDIEVRAAAVSALRLIDDPAADALIGGVLLGDRDDGVRAEAVFAASFRSLDRVLPSLAAALERDPASRVRLGIVQLLGHRRGDSPSCDALLGWAQQHDGDAAVRDAASSALRV